MILKQYTNTILVSCSFKNGFLGIAQTVIIVKESVSSLRVCIRSSLTLGRRRTPLFPLHPVVCLPFSFSVKADSVQYERIREKSEHEEEEKEFIYVRREQEV